MARLPIIDADEAPGDRTPICPNCERSLAGLVRQQLNDGLGKAYLWSCPSCRKALGVSHRKGFWMG